MLLQLVKAEALGFVERRADPDDGRAKIVAVTPAGPAMLERVRQGAAAAECRMVAAIGAAFVNELRMSDRNDLWRAHRINRVLLLPRVSASSAFAGDVLRVARA